jgi:hypothetical protein
VRGLRGPGLLLPLLLWSGACSLFTSLSGFSEGEEPGVDAAPAEDGGVFDAQPDVTTGGGLDAGDAFVPEAGAWCATHAPSAMFCADFDSHGFEVFDERVEIGGTLTIDSAQWVSPPRSLLAVALPSADPTRVRLTKRSGVAAATEATIAFDARVEGRGGLSRNGQIGKVIFFPGGADYYEIGIAAREKGTEAVVWEYSSLEVYGEHGAFALPNGTWRRIQLHVTLEGATGHVDVEVDGKSVLSGAELTPPFASGTAVMEIGVPYSSQHEGWTFRLDNVTFDAR